VYYRYTGSAPGEGPRWLPDLLWGYALNFAFGHYHEKEEWLKDFTDSLFVDQWHARIGLDEMLSHRYLTEDNMTEETVFSSGAAIWVNFSAEPHTVEGRTVPGHGYLIRE